MSVQLLLPMLMRMVASTWQLMVLAWQRYLDWASTPKHFLSAHMMMVMAMVWTRIALTATITSAAR